MQRIKYLFLGAPVPTTSEFMLPGVGGAGNLAVTGIAEGLVSIAQDADIVGFWGIRSFPHVKKLFVKGQFINFESSHMMVRLLPDCNLIFIREFTRFITSFFYILLWGLRNRKASRVILTYNYSVPPITAVVLAAWITRSKVVPIAFDMGTPLTHSGYLRDKLIAVKDIVSNTVLRRVAGACVIVSAIQRQFFPQRTAMLLDGGLSHPILSRLFPLKRKRISKNQLKADVNFLLAGSLERYNGIFTVLEAMKFISDKRIKLYIAGRAGADVEKEILAAVKHDSRIVYLGVLSLDRLFDCYKAMDVFLNVRLTKEVDTKFFFPSKFFEALAVGRLVLSTNVAHLKAEYGKYCYVMEGESSADLARSMMEAVNMGQERRDEIGLKGREFVLKHHMWQAQMRRVDKYCRNLVSGIYRDKCGMVDVA